MPVTLICAVAATRRTRFAAPELDAAMAAVAVVGLTFSRSPPVAVTAMLAAADTVSSDPPIWPVPFTAIAAVASTGLILLAVAVADAEMLGVAETYFIAAGPTLAVATDAVRFAAGIAPVSSDLLA